MIRSMTAFARREVSRPWGVVSWELRSVNHRYLEVALRLPEALRVLDPQVRERISAAAARGKIDCSLRYAPGAEAMSSVSLNKPLAERLIAVAGELEALLGPGTGLAPIDVLRWPGVVSDPEPNLDPIKDELLATLDEALADLVATREREGARITALIRQRCDAMVELVERVRARRPEVVERQRNKLTSRLAELNTDSADSGRLEQELTLIAQRLDIDEELDRLDAHLSEIADVLRRDEPTGRRLDFLMQELNREANTLSSKSADAETTRAAVDLKVFIEQMREQVQNIE